MLTDKARELLDITKEFLKINDYTSFDNFILSYNSYVPDYVYYDEDDNPENLEITEPEHEILVELSVPVEMYCADYSMSLDDKKENVCDFIIF